MASDTKLYTKATIYIDGKKASEASSVSISRSGNGSRVMTIAGGFSGISPGSPMMEGTVTSFVPAAGFDFNPGQAIAEYIPVDLTIFAAGKTLNQRVFIERDTFSYATDGAASLEFSFVGAFADFV